MAGALDIALLALGGLLCVGLLWYGAVQFAGEQRLDRRLVALSPGTVDEAPQPQISRWATLLNGGAEAREEVERYLAAAGFLSPNGALSFALIRLGATAGTGFGLYLLLALTRKPSAATVAVPVGAAALVFLAAKWVLKMSSARRLRKISAELPFTLDILVMMVESGASLDQCLRSFAASEGRAAPIVRVSVAALVADIDRGMPYDQALGRWADRLGVAGARELAAVLRQALNQGTELTNTLREFAREFAERRIFAAREAIGRKTTQMTIAMLVLLMPALMIVLAGPAVSTLGTTIRHITKK